jgi:hypothetical protein
MEILITSKVGFRSASDRARCTSRSGQSYLLRAASGALRKTHLFARCGGRKPTPIAKNSSKEKRTKGRQARCQGAATQFQQFVDPRERWTYRDKSQIDYLLVSKPLANAMTTAGVERRGLFRAEELTRNLQTGQTDPFPSVTSDTNDASDHAAVWAEFRI